MRTKKKHIFRRKQRGGACSAEKEDLNRQMNIADCYKDGSEFPSVVMLKNFQTAVEDLFGSAHCNMFDIQQKIMKDPLYGDVKPEKICWLQVITQKKLNDPRPIYEKNDIVNKLPVEVEYAFHDSGYSPTQIKYEIKQILSPGSYIDPASRAKLGDGDVSLERGVTEITKADFEELGFEKAIHSFKGEVSGSNMKITITFPDRSQFHTERTKEQGHAGEGTDYFGGNVIKNKWFNNNPDGSPDIAKKYVLCKELGDTLQVMYANKIIKHQRKPSVQYCMFTSDNVVLARCRQYRISVCVQQHVKKEYANVGSCYYYMNSEITDAERISIFKAMYKKQCLDRNATVIQNIKDITDVFYFDNRELPLDEGFKKLFNDIIKHIQEISEDVKKGDPNMTLDEYKKFTAERTAFSLVSGKKINYNFSRVFPKPTRAVWDEGELFGVVIHRMISRDVDRSPKYKAKTFQESQEARDERFKLRKLRLEAIKAGNFLDRINSFGKTFSKSIQALVEKQGAIIERWREAWSNWFGSKQRGGGHDELVEPCPTQDFYDMACCIFLEKIEEADYLKREYNPKTVTKEEVAEDFAYEFLCFAYNYLNYIGDTPIDEKILSPLIQLYMDGKIHDYEIDGFEGQWEQFIKGINVKKQSSLRQGTRKRARNTTNVYINEYIID
jgi:hypothetical protein